MASKEFGPDKDYPPISPPSGKPMLEGDDTIGYPTTFLELLDTINTYVDHAGKVLVVNPTETGVTVSLEIYESDKHFAFTQPTPSDDWGTINHDLAKFPSIQIFNASGHVAHADINHVDNNNVIITSDVAFAGVAYFN